MHWLRSSKILFSKNSEQLAKVAVKLSLKICRWLYIPIHWLVLHNVSSKDNLWPVGGARTCPSPQGDCNRLYTYTTQKDGVIPWSLWPTSNLGSAYDAPKDFTEADRVELAAARAAWAQLWRTLQARSKTPEPLTTEAWFDHTKFESVKPDSSIAYIQQL